LQLAALCGDQVLAVAMQPTAVATHRLAEIAAAFDDAAGLFAAARPRHLSAIGASPAGPDRPDPDLLPVWETAWNGAEHDLIFEEGTASAAFFGAIAAALDIPSSHRSPNAAPGVPPSGMLDQVPPSLRVFGTAGVLALFRRGFCLPGTPDEISAASLNKLVQQLASATSSGFKDMDFARTFLLMYRTFTTPQLLLRKLVERYVVPDLPDLDPTRFHRLIRQPIQLRVVNFLKSWLQQHFSDFSEPLVRQLLHFIDTDVARTSVPLARQLRELVAQQLAAVGERAVDDAEPLSSRDASLFGSDDGSPATAPASQTDARRRWGKAVTAVSAVSALTPHRHSQQTPFPPPLLPKPSAAPAAMPQLTDVPYMEVARQLCIADFSIFARIRPQELLGLAWTLPAAGQVAPNIVRLTKQFNQHANMVTASVLQPATVRERVKVYGWWLKVGRSLRELGQFHALQAVLGGLGTQSVHRLRQTQAALPKKRLLLRADLLAVMNSTGSFAALRAELAAKPAPKLPYLGMYLTDLNMLEELSEARTDANLVNFGKARRIDALIAEIQSFQTEPFHFQRVPAVLDVLAALPVLTEQQLDSLSRSRE
jgi:glycine hydroxymethyltransferase/Rap guanine nucleotide exchange factor 1